MSKLLKIIGALIGLVVVTIAGAAVILPMVIDPNDYKDRISAEVSKRTGRDLQIIGDIGLSVFPWLGLDLGETVLGNAEGFGDQPMARMQSANVKVKLLPLLSRELEVDTVVLEQPVVALRVKADGTSNWQDLLPAGEDTDPPADDSTGGPGLNRISLQGLTIRGAEISYEDAQAGTSAALRDFNLEIGAFASGREVPLSASGELRYGEPQLVAMLDLATRFQIDLQQRRGALSGLDLKLDAKGEDLPDGHVQTRLQGDMGFDLAADTANVESLRLTVANLEASGEANITSLSKEPQVAATLALAPFSPRELMTRLGNAPITSDDSALTHAEGRVQLQASAEAVDIGTLSIKLDDSQLGGSLAVRDFANPAVRFKLELDQIDLDRYLAPPQAETEQGATGEADSEPVDLEGISQLLADLNAAGEIRVGKIKVMNVRASDIVIEVKGTDGALALDPLKVQLYDGGLDGTLRVNAKDGAPAISTRQKLSGVALGPLLKDAADSDLVTGAMNVDADLSARGNTPEALTRTLDGTLSFRITDGVLRGINVDRSICEARATVETVRGKADPDEPRECDPATDTRFTAMRGSARVDDGVMQLTEFFIEQPRHKIDRFYQITGSGTVDLNTQALDLQVRAAQTRRSTSEGGDAPENEIKGRPIPVAVTGTFESPKVRPDLRAAAEEEVRRELGKQVEKQLEIDEDDSDAERAGKQLLKGLFGN